MKILIELDQFLKKRRKHKHKNHHKSPPNRVKHLRITQHMSTVTLNWTLPTTRVDGSALALTDIAQVNVFDQVVIPNTPSPNIQIGVATGAATSFTTGTLVAGQHLFTVTVQDTDGNISAVSNVATATVGKAVPSAATSLTATVN